MYINASALGSEPWRHLCPLLPIIPPYPCPLPRPAAPWEVGVGGRDVKTSPLSNAWTQVYTVLQEESEAQGLPFERAWRT